MYYKLPQTSFNIQFHEAQDLQMQVVACKLIKTPTEIVFAEDFCSHESW